VLAPASRERKVSRKWEDLCPVCGEMMTAPRAKATILEVHADLLRVHHGESVRVLYVGVTNNLARRVNEHRSLVAGFTSRYRITRLVHFEEFANIWDAIARRRRSRVGAVAEGPSDRKQEPHLGGSFFSPFFLTSTEALFMLSGARGTRAQRRTCC